MDISLWSLLSLIVIIIIYYVVPSIGKPKLTLEILDDIGLTQEFYKKTNVRLGIFFVIILIVQLFLNTIFLANKCGSSLRLNIGAAFLYTFIPWTLIFGLVLVVLLVFPGFKSAFSDVVGYASIAGSAHTLFSDILKNTDINEQLQNITDQKERLKLEKSAEAIIKICGNNSILINQLSPENFNQVWENLVPLMKPDFLALSPVEMNEKKQSLLDLVVTKDNVGEAFWYVYTGIFVSSLVFFYLASRKCVQDVDTIKKNYEDYMRENEKNPEP